MRTHAKVKLCQFFKQNTAVHVFYGEGFISTNTNWFIYFVFVVKLPWCRARAPVAALCTPFGIRLPQKNMLVCDIRILCALLALSFKCFYLLQNVLNWMVSLKLISIVFREEGGGGHTCFALVRRIGIFMVSSDCTYFCVWVLKRSWKLCCSELFNCK